MTARPAPIARLPSASRGVLPVPAARLVAFAGLASFGALNWATLLAPSGTGALMGCVAAGTAGGALLALTAQHGEDRRRRVAVTAAVSVGLALVVAAAAGVPAASLAPRGWGDLTGGISSGLSALPSVSVPYGGVEAWTRIVLLLGGALLIAVAAVVTFVPRHGDAFGYPGAGAVALGALYAVPAVERSSEHPFLAGLAFSLLLGALLWLEHVPRHAASLALGVVGTAGLLGLAVAPRLDGARPIIDYEHIAESLASGGTTTYSWNHRYGPLDWPRDGREVLRVTAPRADYWKATNLETFDGREWVEGAGPRRLSDADLAPAALHPEWQQSVQVSVRALSSDRFVAAGTILDISHAPRTPLQVAPGVWSPEDGRVLRRGHSYRAQVYVPRPQARQLRAAGTAYPVSLGDQDTSVVVPWSPPGGPAGALTEVTFPAWLGPGVGERRPYAPDQIGLGEGSGITVLDDSPYGRVYALAQRLRAHAATPYDFVLAVERHLRRGFDYSERPPPSAVPLVDFLFRDRSGYCQQFSGAEALLLRMGGVPARVSSGFAPGSPEGAHRYVVRDVDAHSWVEVYFPGIGWVTRDPTPGDSPARSQITDTAGGGGDAAVALGAGDPLTPPAQRDPAAPAAAGAAAAADGAGPSVAWWEPGAILGLGLVAGATWVAVRRRRARAAGIDGALAEVRRALARAGLEAGPSQTLRVIAARFAHTPGAAYLDALAQSRYGYPDGPPTRAQRAALRRSLAARAGRFGRVRAWWALPPV